MTKEENHGASAMDIIAYTREKIKKACLNNYVDSSEEKEEFRNIIFSIEERIEAAYLSGYDSGYKAAKQEKLQEQN